MIPVLQVRQLLFILLIAALSGVVFWNLSTFIPALMGAYTLYVLLKTPTLYCTRKWRWPIQLSAAMMILVSFIIILSLMTLLIGMLSTKFISGIEGMQQALKSAETTLLTYEKSIHIHLITAERIQMLSDWAMQTVSNILNATLSGLVMLLITYFMLWFMLTSSQSMESTFFNWLPIKPANIEFIRLEIDKLVFSNALGIPVMGLTQAFAGLIGYSIAGIDDLWFWVFITFVAGMVPFLGVMLAFLPLSLLLFSKGQNGQAIFILAYGAIVIGSVDNIARMWLLRKIGHTHPLITLFGVIIGLRLFGFIGFIFGPILIAMVLLLVKIYAREFK